jgi:hypothetical protein
VAKAAGLAATLAAQGFADTTFLPTDEVSCHAIQIVLFFSGFPASCKMF